MGVRYFIFSNPYIVEGKRFAKDGTKIDEAVFGWMYYHDLKNHKKGEDWIQVNQDLLCEEDSIFLKDDLVEITKEEYNVLMDLNAGGYDYSDVTVALINLARKRSEDYPNLQDYVKTYKVV